VSEIGAESKSCFREKKTLCAATFAFAAIGCQGGSRLKELAPGLLPMVRKKNRPSIEFRIFILQT